MDSVMAIKIFHCNKAYGEDWLADITKENGMHYRIILAIVEAIKQSDGGEISKQSIYTFDPEIEEYVTRRRFKIFPAGGQALTGNGEGIFHAKFASSKSVAVLWWKLHRVIHVTFDDHAPVKYHRAIFTFHRLRVGKYIYPLRARSSRKLMELLKSKQRFSYRGIDLKRRHHF
ncbi:hypothetical protein [Paraburkholderia caffeinilytica]|uniref:hypothetical protein n=1 Tax=Paraburkholderia caffeinilytica TaxID=1761016 RepID=UPI0038BCBA13